MHVQLQYKLVKSVKRVLPASIHPSIHPPSPPRCGDAGALGESRGRGPRRRGLAVVKMVRIIHTYIHTCMHAYTHTHTYTYLHKIKILLPLHFILYTDDVSSANGWPWTSGSAGGKSCRQQAQIRAYLCSTCFEVGSVRASPRQQSHAYGFTTH